MQFMDEVCSVKIGTVAPYKVPEVKHEHNANQRSVFDAEVRVSYVEEYMADGMSVRFIEMAH